MTQQHDVLGGGSQSVWLTNPAPNAASAVATNRTSTGPISRFQCGWRCSTTCSSAASTFSGYPMARPYPDPPSSMGRKMHDVARRHDDGPVHPVVDAQPALVIHDRGVADDLAATGQQRRAPASRASGCAQR